MTIKRIAIVGMRMRIERGRGRMIIRRLNVAELMSFFA